VRIFLVTLSLGCTYLSAVDVDILTAYFCIILISPCSTAIFICQTAFGLNDSGITDNVPICWFMCK